MKEGIIYNTIKNIKGIDQFDNYELDWLLWFKDNFISKDELNEYYKVSKKLVKKINNSEDKYELYKWFYRFSILPSVKYIESRDFRGCYIRLRETIKIFKEQLIDEDITRKLMF